MSSWYQLQMTKCFKHRINVFRSCYLSHFLLFKVVTWPRYCSFWFTCFLSVAGTWLKYSQACQNKMFSSLNSFLRNSCRDRPEFVSALRLAMITFSVAATALRIQLQSVALRKDLRKCGRRTEWVSGALIRVGGRWGARWFCHART